MPKRIEEDWKFFRDIFGGRIRKALKKFIKNGTIFKTRPNGERVPITIPGLDIPHFVHGDNDEGTGRGEGKPGDIIKKGKKGKKGNKPGDQHADPVTVNLDLEEVLQFLQHELELPDLKPKPNEAIQQEEIKYNSISLNGPESLRHNRRTMLQAMKRQAAMGQLDDLQYPVGFDTPVRMLQPINADKRYRQYKIIQKPSSNAVIFFARDGSGSMDDRRCDVVSNMAWWIDIWIRRFYKRVERRYVWHDTEAVEVDEHRFYNDRFGGGTRCSSALKLIAEQFENRYPINKWNIYVFYFTDGDNWDNDNETFVEVLKSQFPPEAVNFVGITQIIPWGGMGSGLKQYVDNHCVMPNLKTAEITGENDNEETLLAIKTLLGSKTNSPAKA